MEHKQTNITMDILSNDYEFYANYICQSLFQIN